MANLQLTLIDGGAPDQRQHYDVSYLGGTIGRSQECDWVLHDTDRFISNKHILITYHEDNFHLTDLSSNGVFVNGSLEPVGKGSTYVLQLSDIITLGKFRVLVSSLSTATPSHNVSQCELPPKAPSSNGSEQDLLSLVAGASPASATTPLGAHDDNGGDLGLFDILNGNSHHCVNEHQGFTTASASMPTASVAESSYRSQTANEPYPAPAPPKTNMPSQESQGTIPDDWDMSDLMDADSADIAPVEDKPRAAAQVAKEQVIVKQTQPDTLQPATQPPTQPAAQPPTEETTQQSAFFDYLYEQLGLPLEYRNSVDKTVFANDLVHILNTTTQGIMGLLAGRSVFKQESRLNMTMIKPQSNNPIKFSLDPSDTFEMLLVKKKPGYLSAQAAYSEALNDIQTHQMAFLAGLQASLSEILNALNPQVIEQEAEKKPTRFMAIKGHSVKWNTFADKQQGLHKQVSENLNDVLSTYFSPAYEKFIDNAKQRD